MKIYLFLINLLLTVVASAQVSKIYINSKGKFITEPKGAVSYALIDKLSDTAYQVRTYDMKDTILTEGTYKDELLNIPNGKFSYYLDKKLDPALEGVSTAETGNFVWRVGYFANGVKTGMWVDFWKRGLKKYSFVYKVDKLNGRYRRYDYKNNNYITEEGNYVDNDKEGEWNTFGFDTLGVPVNTKIYTKKKLVKNIDHFQQLRLPKHFESTLLEKLANSWQPENSPLSVEIAIGADGRIINPVLNGNYSPQIERDILDVLKMAGFTPQMYDGKVLTRKYIMEIRLAGSHLNYTKAFVTLYYHYADKEKEALNIGP